MTHSKKVIIVGSGVIGLTIAHLLTREEAEGCKVTVVARETPDEDLESTGWASPWAGANWAPLTFDNERGQRWERKTTEKMRSLMEGGLVTELPSEVYYPEEPPASQLWFKDMVKDFTTIPTDQLPPGSKFGIRYTTICLHTPAYLQWLKGTCEKAGVKFVKRRLSSIEQALEYVDEDDDKVVVVNATGLGARSLIGVQDPDVYPIRGQTILVQTDAPQSLARCMKFPSPTQNKGQVLYVIPRPSLPSSPNQRQIILGGTYHIDSWNVSIDLTDAKRILEGCAAFLPELLNAKIISHNVGLRPARKGGARVELESIKVPVECDNVAVKANVKGPSGGELKVVHAYGIAGAGYQSSWGMAGEAAQLVREAFN